MCCCSTMQRILPNPGAKLVNLNELCKYFGEKMRFEGDF